MTKVGVLFVVSGPSGVGKSSILKEVLSISGLIFSISFTTRQRRDYEINGKDYFFISEKEFLERIKNDSFIEWAKVHNNYYGTSKDWILYNLNQGKNIVLDIDVVGAKNIKQKFPNSVLIFISPPSIEELEIRLRNRNTDINEVILQRISNSIIEIEESNFYDYKIVNDQLDFSVAKMKDIMSTEIQNKNILKV